MSLTKAPTSSAKAQAGGGTSPAAADPHSGEIHTFEPNVLDVLRHYHSNVAAGKETPHVEQANPMKGDFATFLKYMASPESKAQLPAPKSDLTFPLSSYFISSSHNTYLMGHQLYGTSTVDGYKNVLLRGCRCVEIDCWDGDESDNETTAKSKSGAEPVVTHGYTATKDITFRSVCETICKYAFTVTDLPLIISLEVHTNHEQQQMMVDIMNSCFKGMLCKPISEDDWGPDCALPTPEKLKNKILIKVKYTPPTKAEPNQPPAHVDTSSSSSDEEGKPKAKVSKVIEALSKMGLYTRSYHFSNLSQPEASMPTHIFSLSESSLIGLYKDDPEGVFNHNKDYMMRAYPKGTRISSSNLDPSLFWRVGAQMVALNWQKIDTGMMLQEAMFQGTGGWALKPKAFQSTASYKDSRAHLMKGGKSVVKIALLAAQNIPIPEDVDAPEKMRPFVKIEIHCDSSSEREFKQRVGPSKGQHPKFDEFKPVVFENLPPLLPELSFARFKVVHSDRFGRDDFAAWACIRLDRLSPGLRFIHLWDIYGQPTDGVLLARIEYQWNV